MLSKEQNYFLTTLSDHLNGRKTAMPEGLDESLLLSISQKQQCEGIVYYQTHLPALHTQFASNSFYAINRSKLLNKIHELFAANNIGYLIFKGSEIAQLYPVPQLRTMGDSDIMVHEEDKQKAHELLLSLGMVNDCLGPNEWVYHKGDMEFELHHRLMNDELVSLPEHKAFMSTVWDHAVTEDGIQYHIDWDYHLIFLLLHLRKHFLNSGVGFRQFMDIAAVAKNRPINWGDFEQIITELQIKDFVSICAAFIKKWFGVDIPFAAPVLENDFYDAATQQVFDNGVFGFNDENNRENYTVIRLQRGRIRLVLESCFPSYRNMSSVPKYAFLKGRPWLLPIAWLYRFAAALNERTAKREAVKIRKQMGVTNDRVNERKAFLMKWGLEI